MTNNLGPLNWNTDEKQNVAGDNTIQLPNSVDDSIILQNRFPQEVRPTCIIWEKFEKKREKYC